MIICHGGIVRGAAAPLRRQPPYKEHRVRFELTWIRSAVERVTGLCYLCLVFLPNGVSYFNASKRYCQPKPSAAVSQGSFKTAFSHSSCSAVMTGLESNRMVDIAEHFVGLPAGIKPFLAAPPSDVVRLTVGEPGFDTPNPVVEAAIESLQAGNTKYTRSEGSLELCRASAERLSERYGISTTTERVIITPGAKQALLYTFMVCCEPGDEVILLAPAWPSYDIQCRMLRLKPVHVPVKTNDFHPDLDAVRAAITERTKMLVINSPNNPTGAVYTPEEITELLKIAEENDLWVISDEIYARLNWTEWPHLSPASLAGGEGRVITITGWSKSFAMTGWRIGVVTGPSEVMRAMGKLQANACSHIPSFLMDAALAALDPEIDGFVSEFKKSYLSQRRILMDAVAAIPTLSMPAPEGAFYGFVNITGTGMDSITFATRALAEAKVQLIPGGILEGGEGFVRISYACDEETLREGLSRIEKWLASL